MKTSKIIVYIYLYHFVNFIRIKTIYRASVKYIMNTFWNRRIFIQIKPGDIESFCFDFFFFWSRPPHTFTENSSHLPEIYFRVISINILLKLSHFRVDGACLVPLECVYADSQDWMSEAYNSLQTQIADQEFSFIKISKVKLVSFLICSESWIS